MLCGINTGQHSEYLVARSADPSLFLFTYLKVYVHVGDSNENRVYLSLFVKVSRGERSFNIKISQVEDDLAPDNCLQYFTDGEGIIKSFNYDVDGSIVSNREATYLVSNSQEFLTDLALIYQ